MPELPDILLYIECLKPRIVAQELERVRLASPFVLRSVSPPISALNGRSVRGIRRLGKQIVLEFEGDLFLIVHLMIAGRFQWKSHGARIPARVGLAALDFNSGTLLLTEAGSRKRASLNLVEGADALAAFDRRGLEVLDSSLDDFHEALIQENHTLKRCLTDPRLFSGIGNAYSDEILHRARLSPIKLTSKLNIEEIARLHAATRTTLAEWVERVRTETGRDFPSKVTAFRPAMAVHGRYGEPCPDCGSPVQRIVYADNECNYCPTCQTEGRLLADRAMSRLLKEDWPRSLDDWEFHIESRR
jgi:formamidopyrimidine-DNA glycosylase